MRQTASIPIKDLKFLCPISPCLYEGTLEQLDGHIADSHKALSRVINNRIEQILKPSKLFLSIDSKDITYAQVMCFKDVLFEPDKDRVLIPLGRSLKQGDYEYYFKRVD